MVMAVIEMAAAIVLTPLVAMVVKRRTEVAHRRGERGQDLSCSHPPSESPPSLSCVFSRWGERWQWGGCVDVAFVRAQVA
jgi:hypothetical protein